VTRQIVRNGWPILGLSAYTPEIEQTLTDVAGIAFEKASAIGTAIIDGILAGSAEKIPRVIECHQDHDHATDDVDGFDSRSKRSGARVQLARV